MTARTLTALQPKLRTLDAGNNFIETLENISHLTSLEELWVRSLHACRVE